MFWYVFPLAFFLQDCLHPEVDIDVVRGGRTELLGEKLKTVLFEPSLPQFACM